MICELSDGTRKKNSSSCLRYGTVEVVHDASTRKVRGGYVRSSRSRNFFISTSSQGRAILCSRSLAYKENDCALECNSKQIGKTKGDSDNDTMRFSLDTLASQWKICDKTVSPSANHLQIPRQRILIQCSTLEWCALQLTKSEQQKPFRTPQKVCIYFSHVV